jgi:RNA polymerase sigma factor (sigma-70 family)
MPTAVQQLVRKLRTQSLAAENDRALLEAFAHNGDEEAFAEIVRRHGPLVLGVCRRILGNVQDAEDAFQATFLVLARKAESVAWRESIKNWLHGVACRIAMKARTKAHKRRQKDITAAAQQPTAVTPAEAWNELRPLLDQELQQLPARYREVLILCYLEGKTRDEAAELLGQSPGSVKGCLERGRELLRTRLSKRGLALSAALAAGLLSEATASALTPALQSATVNAASQFVFGSALSSPAVYLAQGALHAMLIAKIKTIAFAMMFVFAATGAFWSANQLGGDGTAPIGVTQVARGQDVPREQREKKKSADFFGLIKAIDLKVGTLTVQSLRDGDTNDVKFNLERTDLKVESMLGQALKLDDLMPGLRVHLQLKDQDITSLTVENPTVPAFITSIDADKRTIAARAERMNAEYRVAADAKFTINGKAVRLPQVPLEQRVMLTLTFDKKTVLAVTANKIRQDVPAPREGAKDPVRERAPQGIEGTIIEINPTTSSLSLLTGRNDNPAIQNITVTKEQKIKVQFDDRIVAEIPFAQLTKPLSATVTLADDKKTVTSVTVAAPMMRGVLKSIDTAAKKLVVITDGREEKTFAVEADVPIRNGRDQIRVERVTPAANVNVILGLSLDRQRVIGIVIAQPVRRDGDR